MCCCSSGCSRPWDIRISSAPTIRVKSCLCFCKVQPDLILLDLMMPHLDGYSVMQQIGPRIPQGTYLPILVLTAEMNAEAKQKALTMGAKDFLTKPLDATEVLLRIKNLLETRFLHLRMQDQKQLLEEQVQEKTRELEEARIEILQETGHGGGVPRRSHRRTFQAGRRNGGVSWRVLPACPKRRWR